MSRDAGSREQALANGRRLLASDPVAACRQAQAMLDVSPIDGDAFRLLGAALRRLGQISEAEQAELGAIRVTAYNRQLVEAANAIASGNHRRATEILLPYLERHPDDAAAQMMQARIATLSGAVHEADARLRHALTLAPAYAEARLALAWLLGDQGRPAEASAQVDELLKRQPADARALDLKAALEGRLGNYDAAVALHRRLIQGAATPKAWIGFGHLLRTIGRSDEAVEAYRAALAIDPHCGEAWWSLGNLRTGTLSDDDVTSIDTALTADLGAESRFHLHFALAMAQQERDAADEAFRHYAAANRLRRSLLPYDREETARVVHDSKRVYTRAFFEALAAGGSQAVDPIFIIGMPRSGSTLLEQILASHSAIEGTSELPYVPALWRSPDMAGTLAAEERKALGDGYLGLSAAHRKTGRPRFIDKLPNNWLHIGFILQILPNARIVDIRRHPLGCGWANFRQHFGQGQAYAYDLGDIGHFYRSYVEQLAHFDAIQPGRIHRVFYEDLIEDPDTVVRRLLDYLDLPFEPGCLSFHENKRPVRTPSSEQVRQPINRVGMENWQPYRQWLGPLEEALGTVLTCYPDVPAELKGAPGLGESDR